MRLELVRDDQFQRVAAVSASARRTKGSNEPSTKNNETATRICHKHLHVEVHNNRAMATFYRLVTEVAILL